MTIGPCQATGSSSGRPETRRNRMPRSPPWTGISSPESNSTSERFPVSDGALLPPAPPAAPARRDAIGPHALRRRGVAERAVALEDVREGMPRALDRNRLAHARRNPDVEIAGIGGPP